MNGKKKVVYLKTEVSNLKGKGLEKIIIEFLKSNKKVICKGLNKRPVFIDEYLFFIDSRNSPDKNHRKQSFFPGIELLKIVKKENITNMKIIGGKVSYEFKGMTPRGNLVGVHILEFTTIKDRKLKLISTFWDNKKA